MAVCATCGNDYDKAFTVSWNGHTETFDCVGCAATKIAPQCAHCGCRILGPGGRGHADVLLRALCPSGPVIPS